MKTKFKQLEAIKLINALLTLFPDKAETLTDIFNEINFIEDELSAKKRIVLETSKSVKGWIFTAERIATNRYLIGTPPDVYPYIINGSEKDVSKFLEFLKNSSDSLDMIENLNS